ncbi:unnamed protein product [Cylindrotheca closterium]|uniref:Uncharacterized protein n=1 Tax=Cylindrotheca closterium TaxID=2856 RepID=A0AAD2FEL8_9STRA|nr:unnamed protein product [Cylindrotheca closterium]
MIRSSSFFLILLLAPLIQADDQYYYTYFTLQDDGNVTCSGNYIESATLELDCENDYCPLGTTVTLTGDVTVGNNGLPSDSASIGLSISGYSISSWDDINMCEYLNGGGCPNAGTYGIEDYSLTLPEPSDSLSAAGSMGMTISVGADITFDTGDTEQCTFKIALVNRNNSYSYSLGYLGMAGFMMFGVATTLGSKRRKVATIQLDGEEREGTYDHFELMPKPQGVQV